MNRGFLNGPVCPIYGFGMIIVLFALTPLQHSILLLYIGGVILPSALELVGGWALYKLYHTRWWDYSDFPFNIGGYICLEFCLLWGVFYGADSFQDKSGLTARGGTVEELTALTQRFADELSELAPQVERDENGCIRSTCYATALFNVAPRSVVEIKGAQTAFKNAFGVQILCNDGVMNIEDGTYTTHEIALETWGQDPVVNVNGGTFSGDRLIDTSLITSGRGTININGGKFTYTGMCVMRVLGGKTKNEAGADNTIITATNARLNVYGGEFVLAAGYDTWWSAVVRCGGGTTYGSVLITGGTFVNQKAENSAQVIFKNNTCSSLTITGGKFLANAKQTRFVSTNGCADVVLEDGYRPTDSLTNRATSAYSGTYTYDGASYKIWTLYGATDGKYAMTTQPGAQVRMTAGSTGLRFISTITADKVAAAKALAGDKGSVSFGTVIAPLDYVLRADAFTMAALDGALTDVAAGKRYVDIAAVDGLTEDAEGNVKIRAALTNIKAANLTRAFAAVSYVKVVDATGNATYYYSEFDAVENVRAIRQVAEAALADTKETQEGAYIYAILDEEGIVVAYSRYSESERAVLKTFVA